MAVAIRELENLELPELEAAVGSAAFERGRGYARGGRVLALEWDELEDALSGTVLGNGALYQTTAYFTHEPGSGLTFAEGECSCPVAYDCKHVAALVLAARGAAPHSRAARSAQRLHAAPATSAPTAPSTPPATSAPTASSAPAATPAPAPAPSAPAATPAPAPAPAPPTPPATPVRSWEQPLRSLIQAPAQSRSGTPLAIELALREQVSAGRRTLRLVARPMRPGARGGWVNGSLAWGALDSWHVRGGNYREEHLALLRELHAVHRAGQGRSAYYYSYGAEKTLDLTDCDSSQLWALLEQADQRGLVLIHARAELGELPPPTQGELVLDVTRPDQGGSYLAGVVLDLRGAPCASLEPLLFIGSHGHGLVCAERDQAEAPAPVERRRLRLVRLARPAVPRVQEMLLGGQRFEIPPGELDRFAGELCPALRHVVTVISSDGSFDPPEVSPPTLVLRASYGGEHEVQVGWEWAYQVGACVERAPLGREDALPGVRDAGAERRLLASLDLAESGLGRFGLLDCSARPAAGPVTLRGLGTMQLTVEALPRLESLAGVEVEVGGRPADYREVDETLQVGVSTAEIDGDRDWFDLGVTITVDGRQLPFGEVFAALARGESRMLLADGAHFSLDSPRLQTLRALIEEARGLADSPAAPLRISRYQAGLWAELAALGVVTEQAQAWERQVSALLELDSLPDHEPPAALGSALRPYQREGFGWLASLWELGLGGILADDMGLGKTLQALALICHARRGDPAGGPFLVIAPTSVVPGWRAEAARFAPELRVEAITDTLARSGRSIEELARADVVVTTYTLLRLEDERYRSLQWAGVILDEAQYVKNHQAKTYRCVRELAAPFKLALTGTPMENNLMELWSILSITAPGLFPDPTRFAEQYARPIERRGDRERLARLRRRVKPLIKRRTKELVASELPAKQQQLLEVELHPRHRRLYDTHLQRERQKILGLLDDFDRNRFTILRSITLLRQLSLHAGLIDASHDDLPCAKLGALAEQLRELIAGGHRALVFSQFTGFLARVRERLDQERISYCYLDGATRRRQQVLERFKEGSDPVFLISLKAGGFGLNLTEADYCFLLDPWWNPATEAQAIDRTHRIGQTRPVMVYRMISRGTIEEKVIALARRKAALFSGVMDEGDLFAGSLSAEDIRGLLS
jgi:superfamily II DNA or RNA helicase